jgi:hypothetical protein
VKVVVSLLLILLLPSLALSHQDTVIFDRKNPIQIAAHPHRQVRLKFDQPILSLDSTAPADYLDYRLDPDIPTMAILTGFKTQELNHLFYVTTTDEKVYTFRIQGWGTPYSLRHVKDEVDVVQAATRKQKAEHEPSADERHFREILYAMWGYGAPRVTMQEVNQRVKETSVERITILKRFDAPGYYGFTQKIESIGPRALTIHPAKVRSSGLLFAVSIDGHDPPLRDGESPYVLRPGCTALMHTVYKRKGRHRAALH